MSNTFLTRTSGFSKLNLDVLNQHKPQPQQELSEELRQLLAKLADDPPSAARQQNSCNR